MTELAFLFDVKLRWRPFLWLVFLTRVQSEKDKLDVNFIVWGWGGVVWKEDSSVAGLWCTWERRQKRSFNLCFYPFLVFLSQLPFCVSFSNSLLWYNFLKYSTKHFSCTGLIQESVLKRNPGVDVKGQGGGWWEVYKTGKQCEKGGWRKEAKRERNWNHELALTTKINCNLKRLDYLVHF